MRKTGWLEKEGMSGVRWNRRFVCVQRGSLRYWSEDPGSAANSKRCKGSMQICEDTVVSPTKQARPGRHAFRIDLGMQKFVLSASSEAEVDEWVEAVVRAGGKRSTRWSEPCLPGPGTGARAAVLGRVHAHAADAACVAVAAADPDADAVDELDLRQRRGRRPFRAPGRRARAHAAVCAGLPRVVDPPAPHRRPGAGQQPHL